MPKQKTIAQKCNYKYADSECHFPRWQDDEDFCVFHSPLINEKKRAFKIEFRKHLESIEKEPEKFNYIGGFIFPDGLELKDMRFNAKVRFYNCVFKGDVEISFCEFNSDFGISDSTIHGTLKITWSNFNRLFIATNTIEGNLFYHINDVDRNTLFLKSDIKGYALLRYSIFKGQVEIVEIMVGKSWYIYGVDFSSTSRTRFRNVDFTDAYFFDSKLVDIDFIGINWKAHNNRLIIGDETVLRTKVIPPHYPVKNVESLTEKESIVESLYLQLCANYDRNRLYEVSERFYISAMEVKRLSKGSWLNRNLFSWEAWYKYISLYGHSSTRAFWGIIFIFLFCSVIISFDTYSNRFTDSLFLDFSFQRISIFIQIFFESIKNNFYYLVNPAGLKTNDTITLTAFIIALERVIALIMITFFLLALRRRFKRN